MRSKHKPSFRPQLHNQHKKEKRQRFGYTAKRALLLLLGGVMLGFSHNPLRYGRIVKSVGRAWNDLDRHELKRAIRRLYESQLIGYREHKDGSTEIVLTKQGRAIGLRYKLDEMTIQKPERWDRKWRVILFDIPEEHKDLRNALREKLQALGCILLQKSVFVHPYECREEIDFVIEIFGARRYVRFIEATTIDNELHLKKKFRLL
ncbi:MAG: hypothetical protein Q8R13_02800 [bacterium]|nr:hypothetical protein [bacterium]MDZ4296333.1 hypothetical protein [Patescibacteria group bacterium]